MRAAGLTLVSASAVGFGFTYADQAAVVPLLAAELGLSDLQIGLLSAAVFASYIALTLVTSGLRDRVGPKPVIAAGIAASALGTALFGIGPTFAVLIVAKLIQGVGSALAFVAAARYIAGLYGADRPYFGLGLYGAGYPLGSALALVAMPQIATILGGWRPSFGLEALLLAGLFAIWLRAPSVSGVRREGSMLDALRCANCWLVSLQHAAGFGLAIAAGSWITVFLLREFSLPLALSGVLGSILLFVAVLTRPLGGLAVTTGDRKSTRLNSSHSSISYAVFCYSPPPALPPFPTRRSSDLNCWLVSLQHAAGFGLAIAAGSWITVFLLREFSLPLALSGVLGSILLFVAVLTRPLGGLAVTT